MMRALLLCVTCLFPTLARAACDPVPYTIQAQAVAGKVMVKMPVKFTDPENVPKLSGATAAAGGEYLRSMYGAMGPTVIREVLLNYACRFDAVVDADIALTPEVREAHKAAFRDGVDTLVSASSNYFPAFAAQNFEQSLAIKPTTAAWPALAPAARVPMPYLTQAFGAISDDSFLIGNAYAGYLGGTFSGIEATACGRFVRAALAENAGIVQHLAASMRTTLLTYFGTSPSSVRSAMTMLYSEAASAASVTAPARTENKSLAGVCAA